MLSGNALFVTSKDESTLDVASLTANWNRGPFMRIKKKKFVPTMQLESLPHSEEDEDEEEILITQLR